MKTLVSFYIFVRVLFSCFKFIVCVMVSYFSDDVIFPFVSDDVIFSDDVILKRAKHIKIRFARFLC